VLEGAGETADIDPHGRAHVVFAVGAGQAVDPLRHAGLQPGRVDAVLQIPAGALVEKLARVDAAGEQVVGLGLEVDFVGGELSVAGRHVEHVEAGGQDRHAEPQQVVAEREAKHDAEDQRRDEGGQDARAEHAGVEGVVLARPGDGRALAEQYAGGVPGGAGVGVPVAQAILGLVSPPGTDVLARRRGAGDAAAPGEAEHGGVKQLLGAGGALSFAVLGGLQQRPAGHDPGRGGSGM
jgi:hypothetical protein